MRVEVEYGHSGTGSVSSGDDIGGNGRPMSKAVTTSERLSLERQSRELHINNYYPDLDATQRNELYVIGARVWLLQGPDLVRRGLLIPELFFVISSYVIRSSIGDVQKLRHSFNIRLFNERDEELSNAIKNIEKDSMRVDKASKKIGKGFGFFQTSKKIKSKRLVIETERIAIEDKKMSIELKRKDAIDSFEKRMKF
jgi:hypothetical protein